MNFILLGLFLFNLTNTSAVNVIAREDVMLSATSSNNLRRAAVEGKKLNASIGTKAMRCEDECCGENPDDERCKECLKTQGTGAFGSWNVSDDEEARKAYCEIAKSGAIDGGITTTGSGTSAQSPDMGKVAFPGMWFKTIRETVDKQVKLLNEQADFTAAKEAITENNETEELMEDFKVDIEKLQTDSKGDDEATQLEVEKEGLKSNFFRFLIDKQQEVERSLSDFENFFFRLETDVRFLETRRFQALGEYAQTKALIEDKQSEIRRIQHDQGEAMKHLERVKADFQKQIQLVEECESKIEAEEGQYDKSYKKLDVVGALADAKDDMEEDLEALKKELESTKRKSGKSGTDDLFKDGFRFPFIKFEGSQAHGEQELANLEEKLKTSKAAFDTAMNQGYTEISSVKDATKKKKENLVSTLKLQTKVEAESKKVDAQVKKSADLLTQLTRHLDKVSNANSDRSSAQDDYLAKSDVAKSRARDSQYQAIDIAKKYTKVDDSEVTEMLANLRESESKVTEHKNKVEDLKNQMEAERLEIDPKIEEKEAELKRKIEEINTDNQGEKFIDNTPYDAALDEYNKREEPYKGGQGKTYVVTAYTNVTDMIDKIGKLEKEVSKFRDTMLQDVQKRTEKFKTSCNEIQAKITELQSDKANLDGKHNEAKTEMDTGMQKFKKQLEGRRHAIEQTLQLLFNSLEESKSNQQNDFDEANQMYEEQFQQIGIVSFTSTSKAIVAKTEECEAEETFKKLNEKLETDGGRLASVYKDASETITDLTEQHSEYLEKERKLAEDCQRVKRLLPTEAPPNLKNYDMCCLKEIQQENWTTCRSGVVKTDFDTLQTHLSNVKTKGIQDSKLLKKVTRKCNSIEKALEKKTEKPELSHYEDCCKGEEIIATEKCLEGLDEDVDIVLKD
eukprot:g1914.t1